MKKYLTCNFLLALVFLIGTIGLQAQSQFLDKVDATIKSHHSEEASYVITTELYNSQTESYYYYYNQAVEGIPIEGTESLIVLNKEGEMTLSLDHFKEYDISSVTVPQVTSEQALFTIYNDNGTQAVQATRLAGNQITDKFSVAGDDEVVEIDHIIFPLNGKLVRAYQTTVFDDHGHLIGYVVDASTGSILSKYNLTPQCDVGPGYMSNRSLHDHSHSTAGLTDDGSKYLAFTYDIENPMQGDRKILTEPADLVVSPFGWHDIDGNPGAEFTITRGNNVYAYPERNGDDDPDYDIEGGDSLNFVFDVNLNENPIEYTAGATANLFVINNQLHDVLAHNGFDEASGNFQEMNYSGDGFGEDPVRAHAQSRAVQGPLNNATFSTRDDGTSGVMRMFIWNVPGIANYYLRIEDPYPLRRRYKSAFCAAGPSLRDTSVSGEVVIVEDTIDISGDGCSVIVNADELEGKIAVMYESDSCDYITQLVNAQEAGAIGVVFISQSQDVINRFAEEDDTVRIPSVLVGLNMGTIFENFEDTLMVTLSKPQTLIDGSLDQGVITHELGHGVSNRLVGGKDRTNCLRNGEQMGEGWSDILALILTTTEKDLDNRVRVIGSYVRNENPEGLGIRNKVYSPDMEINDYTYDDVKQTGGQVHDMGEIWATMLYDLLWDMIDEHGFDPDLMYGDGGNRKALKLIIEGMKLTKCNPGFVDGRDGILAADSLLYGGENTTLLWNTFADRGLGADADQGSSDNHGDGKEDFTLPIYLTSRVLVEKFLPETSLETDTINATLRLTNYLHTDSLDKVKVVEYIPEYATYLPGSSPQDPVVTDDSLVFQIDLDDFNTSSQFPMYNITYSYTYDHTRKNSVVFVDSMNYENLDSFKVGLPRINKISAVEFFDGDKAIEMNGDMRYILQYFSPLKSIKLEEKERNYLIFDHRYFLNENTGVNIKILNNEGNFQSTSDLMVVNGYDNLGTYFADPEQVFRGVRNFHKSIVSLDPINLDEVTYRIYQYVSLPDGSNEYWLTQVELWNTDFLSSKVCTEAGGIRYCTEAGTLIEPEETPISTDEPVFTDAILFPNPATNMINFTTDDILSADAKFRIIDVSGKVVQTFNGAAWSGTSLYQFDVSKLIHGIYFLEVQDHSKVESFKFTKQ